MGLVNTLLLGLAPMSDSDLAQWVGWLSFPVLCVLDRFVFPSLKQHVGGIELGNWLSWTSFVGAMCYVVFLIWRDRPAR